MIVLKIGSLVLVSREAQAYQQARPLQGLCTPILLGVYGVEGHPELGALILTYGGPPLSIHALPEQHEVVRASLFFHLAALHAMGLRHGDVAGRNLLTGSALRGGTGSVIDFGRAELDHLCAGAACAELQTAAVELGIEQGGQGWLLEAAARTCNLLSAAAAGEA